ncbi:trypsin-like peptidase domain-containing protein [Patescibacteria group bacterium]|nr:trypsin-like peptidase domain-containing protein [Patescibacteria group bacterium]
MRKLHLRGILIGVAIGLIILAAATGGAIADRLFELGPLDLLFPRQEEGFRVGTLEQRILTEESVVIDVAERLSPSVVTVTIQTPARTILEFSPFGGFSSRVQGGQPQDIGSGFIVGSNGLIITNKHVVGDNAATYKVVTQDGTEYEVVQISRDPSNDIAILKIDANGLEAVVLGDSSNLKVGQFVIAIGTALGEFRHTVTTGVISGLGRGITTGSVFEGFVERLDDVIQTDAAINPGNSGGPLLNSVGQVIGINVAVARGAENIGFAIPINIVRQGLEQFKETGKFVSRPFLGVQYQMISQRSAILNDVPEGAFIIEVISASPAETVGILPDDIITKFAGEDVKDESGGLAELISKKKPGEVVSLEVWRRRPGASGPEGDGETLSLSTTLSEFTE